MRAFLALLIVATTGAVALAQERLPNSLSMSGQLDSGAGIAGAGGEVQWIQSVSDRSSLIVGGGSVTVGDAWWGYGRFGGFTTRRRHTVVMASADLGRGAQAGDGFPYARIQSGLTTAVVGRLDVETEVQSVCATHLVTRVVKIGGAYAWPRAVVHTAVHRSSVNSIDWQYVSGRIDVPLGRAGVAAGFTAGTRSVTPDSGVIQLIAQTSQDAFVALSVTPGRAQTTVAVETIEQAGGRRGRVLVGVRLPVGSPASAQPKVPR
jgi:hypothetical protein